jgi:hypothetical protein
MRVYQIVAPGWGPSGTFIVMPQDATMWDALTAYYAQEQVTSAPPGGALEPIKCVLVGDTLNQFAGG